MGEPRPILVFDTSGPALSVGMWSDGKLAWQRVETFADRRPGHAARLAPLIREALEACRLRMPELAGIGLTIGPGSYTGLRIGLATAKGLAFAAGLRLAGVGTLHALALPALAADSITLAWLDARRGQVYAAVYGPASESGESGPAGLAATELLPPARLDRDEALRIARDAADRLGCATIRAVGDASRPGERVRLDALARLAVARLAAGGDDPLGLVPAYVSSAHIGPVPGTANA